jgi:hypothetical protein
MRLDRHSMKPSQVMVRTVDGKRLILPFQATLKNTRRLDRKLVLHTVHVMWMATAFRELEWSLNTLHMY